MSLAERAREIAVTAVWHSNPGGCPYRNADGSRDEVHAPNEPCNCSYPLRLEALTLKIEALVDDAVREERERVDAVMCEAFGNCTDDDQAQGIATAWAKLRAIRARSEA